MTMRATTKEDIMTHSHMYKGSPYYRHVVDHFGRRASTSVAQSICKQHGTTLDALDLKPGKDGRVDMLMLILELGY